MKVILLEDVKSLGKKGDIVNVSDGYARNAILPKKLGVEATSKNLNDLKLQNQHADKVAQENYDNALALKEKLEEVTVVCKLKSGEGGKSFGSISSKEISGALKEQTGLEVDKKKMHLSFCVLHQKSLLTTIRNLILLKTPMFHSKNSFAFWSKS